MNGRTGTVPRLASASSPVRHSAAGRVFQPSGRERQTVLAPTGWPLQSHLELGAFDTAVPCARLHARQVLWEWGLKEIAETAELVISEIVTNAVRASGGLDQDKDLTRTGLVP